MLLLHQWPAASVSMPVSPISFELDRLPSYTSILLSLLATIVLVSFVRAALLSLRGNAENKIIKQSQPHAVEKAVVRSDNVKQRREPWKWTLPSWKIVSVPSLSLPLSLTPIDKQTMRRGAGMQGKSDEKRNGPWLSPRVRKGGPTFDTPLPALYQSDEPLSMAKLIMSRHTYRKPASRPPPRPVAPFRRAAPHPSASPLMSSTPLSSPPRPPATPPSMV